MHLEHLPPPVLCINIIFFFIILNYQLTTTPCTYGRMHPPHWVINSSLIRIVKFLPRWDAVAYLFQFHKKSKCYQLLIYLHSLSSNLLSSPPLTDVFWHSYEASTFVLVVFIVKPKSLNYLFRQVELFRYILFK